MPNPWEKYQTSSASPWSKYKNPSATQSDVTTTQLFNKPQEVPRTITGDIANLAARFAPYASPQTMGYIPPTKFAEDANVVLRGGLPLMASPLPPLLRIPATGALSGTATLVGNALTNFAQNKSVPLSKQFAEAGKDAITAMGLQAGGEAIGLAGQKIGSRLYGSALKPSTTLSPAERNAIIKTGMKGGYAVSQGGYGNLQSQIKDVNNLIDDNVVNAARQGKSVNTNVVAGKLDDVKKYFGDFAFPKQYTDKIDALKKEFLEQHGATIPVDKAQDIKKRTYQILKNAYGELGSASVESSKAIARGLKEELVNQIPVLKNLNATDSDLLRFEEELARAVGRAGNYNIMKLGTSAGSALGYAVSGSPVGGKFGAVLTHLIDNPNIKSRLALLLNKAQAVPKTIVPVVNATTELTK